MPFQPISRAEFDAQRRRATQPVAHSHAWQIDTAAGRHICWVNYYHLDEEARRANMGVCLPEEELWGRGYGSEAVGLLVDYLFAAMGLEEVRTATWTGNRSMVRCAEKCGFRGRERTPYAVAVTVRGEPPERIEFAPSRADWQAEMEEEPCSSCPSTRPSPGK